MPLATANAVITQVPWLVETPRLPAMVGSETLAMVESSTCMKVPKASASAVTASGPPVMGANTGGAGAAGPVADAAGLLTDLLRYPPESWRSGHRWRLWYPRQYPPSS